MENIVSHLVAAIRARMTDLFVSYEQPKYRVTLWH